MCARSAQGLPTRGTSSALALLLAAAALSGCTFGSDDPSDPAAGPESEPVSSLPVTAPRDVVAGIEQALDQRAAAVRDTDGRAFLAGLARGDQALHTEQSTYFSNLLQLPLGTFRYDFDPAGLVREGEDYWAVVELRMELAGYDALPVITRDRFRFTPRGSGDRMLLTSTSDLQWEVEHDVQQQPWDSGPVVVRSRPGVLGVFDADSVAAAAPLLASVRRGMDDVAGVVPYPWNRSVVVYALSDTDFLVSVPHLPGRDPENLDAVAFPVPIAPDSAELAATRIVMHPRMLAEPGPARNRLVRHELTHVAVGAADDYAPVWLSEGIAEYVSVQPLSPQRREISDRVIDAARDGITDLPPDEGFNDDESTVHYGVAWFACEYVAANYGDLSLWSLLDAFGDPDADPAEMLELYTGINSRSLARKAGKLILATYDPPEPEPTPTPTETPTPSESPTS